MPLNTRTVCETEEEVKWILKTLAFRKGKGNAYHRRRKNHNVIRDFDFFHDKAVVEGLEIRFSYGYKVSS